MKGFRIVLNKEKNKKAESAASHESHKGELLLLTLIDKCSRKFIIK